MGIFDAKPAKTGEDSETASEPKSIEDRIVDQIRLVYDPEIPVNIYEMGLIYEIKHQADTGCVKVIMTLTSPNCPAAQEIPEDVKARVGELPEVADTEVEITWEPPWGPEMMSEEAKLELGFM